MNPIYKKKQVNEKHIDVNFGSTVWLPMADAVSSPAEKKQNSAEEQIAWKRELPQKYLADEDLWNDDDFMPKGASMEYRDLFRKIYSRYFRQICETNGFDIDIYPGEAKAATYIPYLDFEEKTDMLMELANHAIQEYNNKETSVYKYKVLCIEKVNFIWAECREFFLTVKVNNVTLRTPLETFQIHAYKGPHEENIVRLCRQKVLKAC